MVFTVYLVELGLTLLVGVVTYKIIKPSISEGRRAIIAGIVALIFMLGMSALVESLGLIPNYEHVIEDTE